MFYSAFFDFESYETTLGEFLTVFTVLEAKGKVRPRPLLVVRGSPLQPLPSQAQKNRLSLDLETDPRSVGQSTVRGSRLIYPASDMNYGRPTRTVVQSTVRTSDRR
ncbi:hypothetical protein MTR67_052273 [Solanum verrucosum]|uniref:Uncharacterized protein n=1 Tax=Solanum verrucosum TaxID=315347 RepID=A0AAF0V8Y6_SOLVR|nr:hypothetical protein MTR67_052273 [Solanum verrucosum]